LELAVDTWEPQPTELQLIIAVCPASRSIAYGRVILLFFLISRHNDQGIGLCLHMISKSLLVSASLLATGCMNMDMSMEGTFETLPANAVLIANGGSGSIQVIDPQTLTVVSELSVMSGMNPHHFGISPDRAKVLVTATSGDLSAGHAGGHGGAAASTMIYQIDVGSRRMKNVFTVEATAHNAAFTPDGRNIVVSMSEHGMLAIYDPTSFNQTSMAAGFGSPLEATPTSNASVLIAESSSNKVAWVALSTGSVTQRFDVAATPVAAWAASGGNFFVSSEVGMRVTHLVETGSSMMVSGAPIDVGGMPGQVRLSPNGKEIWVALEDKGRVAVFDLGTHAKIAEIVVGTKPHGLAFESAGVRLFVTDEMAGKVFVIDVASRTVTAEIVTGGKPNGILLLGQ
jgi:YVTN family beta-propeller protein